MLRFMLLLLLLSRFSRVRLSATPEMAAHQATPSLGFSRQEHWTGLPFPSPMHESEKWKWRHSVVSNPQRPHGLQLTRLLRPLDFPGKSTGVGCHCLLWTTLWGKCYWAPIQQMNQTESSGLSTLTKINEKWLSQETAKHVEDEKVSFSSLSVGHTVCIYRVWPSRD